MISNEEQLALVREQLGRLEAVLQDMEERIRPQSEKQFRLMSEIYVEHIAKLRQEIADYRPVRGQADKGTKSVAARKKGARGAMRRSA